MCFIRYTSTFIEVSRVHTFVDTWFGGYLSSNFDISLDGQFYPCSFFFNLINDGWEGGVIASWELVYSILVAIIRLLLIDLVRMFRFSTRYGYFGTKNDVYKAGETVLLIFRRWKLLMSIEFFFWQMEVIRWYLIDSLANGNYYAQLCYVPIVGFLIGISKLLSRSMCMWLAKVLINVK